MSAFQKTQLQGSVAVVSPHDVLMAGGMLKQSTSGASHLKRWQKRHFVLSGRHLQYYDMSSAEEIKVQGALDLLMVESVELASTKEAHSSVVVITMKEEASTGGKLVKLKGIVPAESKSWAIAIKAAVDACDSSLALLHINAVGVRPEEGAAQVDTVQDGRTLLFAGLGVSSPKGAKTSIFNKITPKNKKTTGSTSTGCKATPAGEDVGPRPRHTSSNPESAAKATEVIRLLKVSAVWLLPFNVRYIWLRRVNMAGTGA
jgi:hypothetical protein